MTIDIEDTALGRCRVDSHCGDASQYQVKPENTFSIADAPDEMLNCIVRKVQLSESIVELDVFCPPIANNCSPGQFVIVRTSERAERIPLTIADFSRDDGTITMVIQSVGQSSTAINSFGEGERFLDLVGPLGHKSDIENYGTVVCVAGGVGVAPIYPIQRALKAAGNHVISIFGSRNKDLLFWQDKMAACADETYICTDDGSYGEQGFVTNVLQRLIDEGRQLDHCLSIGPGIMMRNTCRVTEREPRTDAARATGCLPIPTVVSLNTIMVDGTGMCGGCRVTVGEFTKFACVDGP
ncbi:cytochrome-c3 hydrogenase, gamma subunit, partial [Kipferlia bialata]|eukprot:g8121.t1